MQTSTKQSQHPSSESVGRDGVFPVESLMNVDCWPSASRAYLCFVRSPLSPPAHVYIAFNNGVYSKLNETLLLTVKYYTMCHAWSSLALLFSNSFVSSRCICREVQCFSFLLDDLVNFFFCRQVSECTSKSMMIKQGSWKHLRMLDVHGEENEQRCWSFSSFG